MPLALRPEKDDIPSYWYILAERLVILHHKATLQPCLILVLAVLCPVVHSEHFTDAGLGITAQLSSRKRLDCDRRSGYNGRSSNAGINWSTDMERWSDSHWRLTLGTIPIVVILAIFVIATPIVAIRISVGSDINRTATIVVLLPFVRTLPILVRRMTGSRSVTLSIPTLGCKGGSADQAQHHSHKKDNEEKAFHISLLSKVTLWQTRVLYKHERLTV